MLTLAASDDRLDFFVMKKVARFVLHNKLFLTFLLIILTLVLAFYAGRIEVAFQYAKLLPDKDSAGIQYDKFRKYFKQDGTILVIGTELHHLYSPKVFNEWHILGNRIKRIKGIQSVVSIDRLMRVQYDDSLGKFNFLPRPLPEKMDSASISEYIDHVLLDKFYDEIIFNKKKDIAIMAVTFKEKELNSKLRLSITDSIVVHAQSFENNTSVTLHLSGMPFIRTMMMRKISSETTYFFMVGLMVVSVLLWLFFRSPVVILFSALVVIMGVVSALGLMVLLGYQLSILSGLLPALLIIIGVPNCILIINKYHHELRAGYPVEKALELSIRSAGSSLFFANITTAIGFAVLSLIDNQILYEFGIIASISVMLVYVYSIVLIPSLFSWLPAPKEKHLMHQEKKWLKKSLNSIALWTFHHRKIIFVSVLIIALIGFYGFTKIKALGYVVDDVPRREKMMQDLVYFEDKLGGVLPFEIMIDTKKNKGVFANNGKVLYRIHRAQKLLREYQELSRSISIADAVKFLNQAYCGKYSMPSISDLKKIADAIKNDSMYTNTLSEKGLLDNFIDSTYQIARISAQMKDIGSLKIKELLRDLQPRLDSIFNYDEDKRAWLPKEERVEIGITGNSVMFLKGNDFLVKNLIESIITAIVIIALLLLLLFKNPFMLLIAAIPCLSLLITSGIMGYFGISLKPSTLLVFSISFGIATDGNLYFLTRFRNAIQQQRKSYEEAIRLTIREIGMSMIYNGLVLFFGFGMFIISDFGGTKALGVLTAFTLLVAYSVDLIVLPTVLLTFRKLFGKGLEQHGND
ncbi:MAG: patched family protein [Bacteroidetes bacterium]|nr:MAG: patched family protein [Bacteroidota bacterium]